MLRLIVLNGCRSEALGHKLRESGAECVVCWRTATVDDAAHRFSTRFFQAIAQRSEAVQRAVQVGKPDEDAALADAMRSQRTEDYIHAFDEAVRAVRKVPSRGGRSRSCAKFILADPEFDAAVSPPPRRSYPRPAGIPLLLCDGAAGVDRSNASDTGQVGCGAMRWPLPEALPAHTDEHPTTHMLEAAWRRLRTRSLVRHLQQWASLDAQPDQQQEGSCSMDPPTSRTSIGTSHPPGMEQGVGEQVA